MSYFSTVAMTGLRPVQGPRVAPQRPGGGGFSVAKAASPELASVDAVALPSLLAMQEAGQEAVEDREARRHSHKTLDALTEMQRALLGGASAGTLENLARLARNAPSAADPRLAGVQRALQLRVAVELARGRAALSA